MRLSLMHDMPLWLVRLRNAVVDAYAAVAGKCISAPRFHDLLDERGRLRIEERYGPEYPQCLADLERLYAENRYRIDRKLLCKAGRLRGEFRGLVLFRHRDCVPVFTMEFSFLHTTVFVVFQDLDCVSERPVRVFMERTPLSAYEFHELVGGIADRLEYGLLPRGARIADGGASLRLLAA